MECSITANSLLTEPLYRITLTKLKKNGKANRKSNQRNFGYQ
jgi:hypothetical protein